MLRQKLLLPFNADSRVATYTKKKLHRLSTKPEPVHHILMVSLSLSNNFTANDYLYMNTYICDRMTDINMIYEATS